MPVTIVVPQLGESVVEGTIGKWLKKVGDPIAKDEPIVEIITDKINIELPAPAAGTLGQIAVAEGVVAQVGDTLGVILGQGESLPAGGRAGGGRQAAPRPRASAPSRPTPQPPHRPPRRPRPRPVRSGTAVATAPPSTDGMRLSPAVRKLAKEHNLDVSQIRGSGMGGRVTREDVLTHIEARQRRGIGRRRRRNPRVRGGPGFAPSPAPAAPRPLSPIPMPVFTAPGSREVEVKPLTNVRKKIAENMVRSRHTTAHCSTWDEVDMTALVELRGTA